MKLCLQLLPSMQQQILGVTLMQSGFALIFFSFFSKLVCCAYPSRQFLFSRAYQPNSTIVLRIDNTTDVIQLAIFFSYGIVSFIHFSGNFSLLFGLRLLFSSRRPIESSLFIFEASSRRFQQSVPTLRGVPPTRETLQNRQHKVVSFSFTLSYFTILSRASFGGYFPSARPCGTILSTVSAET